MVTIDNENYALLQKRWSLTGTVASHRNVGLSVCHDGLSHELCSVIGTVVSHRNGGPSQGR